MIVFFFYFEFTIDIIVVHFEIPSNPFMSKWVIEQTEYILMFIYYHFFYKFFCKCYVSYIIMDVSNFLLNEFTKKETATIMKSTSKTPSQGHDKDTENFS